MKLASATIGGRAGQLSSHCLDHKSHSICCLFKGNQHCNVSLQVTAEERKLASATIGGRTSQLSVAFGKRAPAYDPAWNVKVTALPARQIHSFHSFIRVLGRLSRSS